MFAAVVSGMPMIPVKTPVKHLAVILIAMPALAVLAYLHIFTSHSLNFNSAFATVLFALLIACAVYLFQKIIQIETSYNGYAEEPLFAFSMVVILPAIVISLMVLELNNLSIPLSRETASNHSLEEPIENSRAESTIAPPLAERYLSAKQKLSAQTRKTTKPLPKKPSFVTPDMQKPVAISVTKKMIRRSVSASESGSN